MRFICGGLFLTLSLILFSSVSGCGKGDTKVSNPKFTGEVPENLKPAEVGNPAKGGQPKTVSQ
jgi:hypothetical protein